MMTTNPFADPLVVKKTGSHYTPTILAEFVAQQIVTLWTAEQPVATVRLIDPALGDGELLLALIRALHKAHKMPVHAYGFDTNRTAIELSKARIVSSFPDLPNTFACIDFLNFATSMSDDLFGTNPLINSYPIDYDIVIANPPYVRTQVMGAQQSRKLAVKFGLSGRVDLYYAFIYGISRILRPRGIAGIIVSNRFMTTKSGISVRAHIADKFDILHIWDLGDTQLFNAAVLPAVLLLRKKDSKGGTDFRGRAHFTSIYSINNHSQKLRCKDPISALLEDGVVETLDGKRYHVQHGELDFGVNPRNVWRISTEAKDEWLSQVENFTHCCFGDVGKIRVGVKTTADKVFIRSDWNDMPEEERPELLRLLTTHHMARRYKPLILDKPWQILYTHEVIRRKRKAVNILESPKALRYLNQHRSVLESRRYVLDAGRNWFEIWVPQDPDSWSKHKIVFRDISDKPVFWMDVEGSVVNGDCYWLMPKHEEDSDLLWLALAVGNSSFIEAYYDHCFNNKLYAGRRRFITQYVEKFPIPVPDSDLGNRIIQITKQIYSLIPSPEVKTLEAKLDQLIWEAFGFSVEEVAG